MYSPSFLHRTMVLVAPLLGASLLVACEVVSRDQVSKQDTTTVLPSRTAVARADSARTASAEPSGVPAVPRDSASGAVSTPADAAAIVALDPPMPKRGGVVFATAEIADVTPPRCTWKGVPLPCYRYGPATVATIPLSADEPAGTFSFVIGRPDRVGASRGELARQVDVADVDFGRELVFLPSDAYALVKRRTDIARDGRAFRQIVAGETDHRYWSGAWRQPVAGKAGTGYGVERFYYPASDSSRVLSVGHDLATHGTFAADTSPAAADVPGWRHAGVDIPAARGTPVIAPAAGVVADVGDYTLTGHTVVVDHGQGVFSAYFHLDTALVRKGDVLRAGRTLGRVGMTGLATGPHLHYGLYVHGRDVNPAAWYAMPVQLRTDGRDSTARRAAR